MMYLSFLDRNLILLNMKSIRTASSLILAVNNVSTINIIALKRSEKTSHFPNAFVFPGGNCDAADENPNWLKIFPTSELEVSFNLINENKSSYNSIANRKSISKAISSRITAIRETFEECGILLCKHKADKCNILISHYNIENKNEWREKIRRNPIEFLNLCKKFELFPNLKGLHLHSNWITPRNFIRRYNALFFIAILDSQVVAEPDNIEIQEIKLQTADEFIKNPDVFLPPPQLYEMSKLQQFTNLTSLCKYIRNLDQSNCYPFIPIHVNTTDGMVIILPGDEKYKSLYDLHSQNIIEANCNIADFRNTKMHRIEYKGENKKLVQGKVFMENIHFSNNSIVTEDCTCKL